MHAQVDGRCVPVAHALLPGKEESSYAAVLKRLNQLAKIETVEYFISDCEIGMMRAIESVRSNPLIWHEICVYRRSKRRHKRAAFTCSREFYVAYRKSVRGSVTKAM